MMQARRNQRRTRVAFSIIELLVVIAIIALLAGVLQPALSQAIQTAQSARCAANLTAIGVAIMQAATDNNNQYPEISQAASNPYPPGSNAQNLITTLSPYGMTTNGLQCPTDMAAGTGSAFSQSGSSYEWNPAYDDEVTVTPILYYNAGVQIPVNSSRIHLCYDFNPIHRGRPNYLYGDGHVKAH
jgi:prepilin-type processing-associated H-X9-DG protein